jgi:hypothetical protein
MSDADRPGRSTDAIRRERTRAIPIDPHGPQYGDALFHYLDRLLDEALEETFPASDPTAVPTRREIERKW